MEANDNVICIAISKIFSTGINIKNIHNIIFATPGKAKVKLIQSIGRGLRLHENKDILKVIDISDNLHYANKHMRKREDLYNSEKLNYEIRRIKTKKIK
jgi:type I site-specific restriction endonuclease